jgi:hypothetical protein
VLAPHRRRLSNLDQTATSYGCLLCMIGSSERPPRPPATPSRPVRKSLKQRQPVYDPECVQTARGLFLPAAVLCEFIASIAIACAHAAARAARSNVVKIDQTGCGGWV